MLFHPTKKIRNGLQGPQIGYDKVNSKLLKVSLNQLGKDESGYMIVLQANVTWRLGVHNTKRVYHYKTVQWFMALLVIFSSNFKKYRTLLSLGKRKLT